MMDALYCVQEDGMPSHTIRCETAPVRKATAQSFLLVRRLGQLMRVPRAEVGSKPGEGFYQRTPDLAWLDALWYALRPARLPLSRRGQQHDSAVAAAIGQALADYTLGRPCVGIDYPVILERQE